MFKKVWKWIENHELLIVVLAILALLRIPSIFEPNWYGDEGIYLVLGQALRKGLVWYKDIHDNKPPMLYLLAAFSGNVAMFRTLLLVWMLATTALFDSLAIKMLGKGRVRTLVLFVFVLITTIPTIEGNIANAEIFMMLPTLVGLKILIDEKKKKVDYLLAGLAFSLAFLFKVPAFFEFAGIGFFIFAVDRGKSIRKLLKDRGFWLVLVGFVIPITITIAYYFGVGAGGDYIRAAFMQNVGYLSSWKSGSITKSGGSSQSGLIIRALLLFAAVVIFSVATKKANRYYRLVWIWMSFALFGALLSERPYPHYLIQVVPSFCLLAGLTLEKNKRKMITSLLAFGVIGLAIVRFNFYFYPTIPYYERFLKLINGKINYEQFSQGFDSRSWRSVSVGKYIRALTENDDKIFIWGDEPFIYLTSSRKAVGKYVVAYHVIDFQAKDETIKKLESSPPKIIVWPNDEKRDFTELRRLLNDKYSLINNIQGAEIYLRL